MTAPSHQIAWVLLLGCVLAAAPGRAQTLPQGFQERIAISGRTDPTAIRFAPLPSGHVFLAEKSGLVWLYDGVDDPSPSQVVDLRASVHNFWDRGLLGLAVHPDYPNTRELFVLYAHDTWPPGDVRFGDSTQPRWGAGDPTPSTSDPCPTPPGPTDDGCVVYGRLSRLSLDPLTSVGTEQVLLQGNWCQQYPSHSTGDLVFGADGYLYLSAGDGASFNFVDSGQEGAPVNPCDDPADEGGALRSQDVLAAGDPTSFDGTILRLDVATTPPSAPLDNPLAGGASVDDDFIIANGLRNPFRINLRPGTDEIWIADVGWGTWEELNRIPDPTGLVENFGWPCYEGGNGASNVHSGYSALALCQNLVGNGPPAWMALTPSHYAYDHGEQVVPGEACGTGSSSVTGVVFNNNLSFPNAYDDALFFADSSRKCIWNLFADANGDPDPTNRAPLVSNASGRVVDLQMGHDGNLYYVDFDNGNVYVIEFFAANEPPTAIIAANPTNGLAPLDVQFDGSSSSDPEDGANLLYAWDLDGDGELDDSASVTPHHTFTQAGAHLVRLRVEDTGGATDEAQVVITADNTPPVATILTPSPSLTWVVGQEVFFTGEGVDPQDGVLPASQLDWDILLHHCDTPEDCHTHAVTSLEGVAGGSFFGPDHEYPSWVELRLTARDLPPADWLDPAWPVRRSIAPDSSGQTETLVDFPVLVHLDPTRIDYPLARPDGADLRFSDGFGNPLAHEIESWTPGGDSYIWVKLPAVVGGGSADPFYLYYGNPGATRAEDPAAVWSEGYVGVWHLHDDLLDSSASGADATNQGSTDAAGAIGGGQHFDGSAWIDAGTDPALELTGSATLEAWIAIDDPDQVGAPRVLSKKNAWNGPAGFNLEYKPSENNLTSVGSGGDYARADGIDLDSGWHYVGASITGGAGAMYVDGVDQTTDSTLSPLVADAQPLHIGRRSGGGDHFLGRIDEVRISNVARSADWWAAQHLSMADTYLGFGPEEGLATLSHSKSILLHPETVDLSFGSIPSSLSLDVGGINALSPFDVTVMVGSTNSVIANDGQLLGNEIWDFAAWSDGGAQGHLIVAPADPAVFVASFSPRAACLDSLDNDGDGLVDHPLDPDCTAADDPSELPECLDGLDNDGDGAIDYPADPGCRNKQALAREEPECSDGVDNDGDGDVDHPADDLCQAAWDDDEASNPRSLCGIGWEIALVLLGLRALRRRARTSQ
jgi:glucose/arabinose dehydrogenase